MTIAAVVFDWGGTLAVPVDVELRDLWRAAAQHLDPTRVEEVTERLAAVERAVWGRVAGSGRSARLLDLLREASDQMDLDVADAVLHTAQQAHLDAWTPSIRHHADAAPTLRALRGRGLAIGLLSNTHWPRAYHEAFLERDGLADLIDVRAYTSELDWMKPHPEAFAAVTEALAVPADACVFVGDRPTDDIAGARGVGMRTVWIRNDYAPGDPSAADAAIDRLAELPAVVDRWWQSDARR